MERELFPVKIRSEVSNEYPILTFDVSGIIYYGESVKNTPKEFQMVLTNVRLGFFTFGFKKIDLFYYGEIEQVFTSKSSKEENMAEIRLTKDRRCEIDLKDGHLQLFLRL